MGVSGRDGQWTQSEPQPLDLAVIDPIHEYPHSGGALSVVIGGMVYRAIACLSCKGLTFLAIFSTGNVWALRYAGSGAIPSQKCFSRRT